MSDLIEEIVGVDNGDNENPEAPEVNERETSEQFRVVDNGGTQAQLIQICQDDYSGENRVVMMAMVGAKNAVKALLSYAKDEKNQGNGANIAFSISAVGRGAYGTGFSLPDGNYMFKQAEIKLPERLSWLPRLKRPAMHEGRIISINATSNAKDKGTIYVPVLEQIFLPETPEETKAVWRKYLDYATEPLAAQWKSYQPPAWCEGLFNLYAFMNTRLHFPLHPYWMPYVFEMATRNACQLPRNGRRYQIIKWIPAEVHPLYRGAVEGGVYRIGLGDNDPWWRELFISNPDRFDGIVFEASRIATEEEAEEIEQDFEAVQSVEIEDDLEPYFDDDELGEPEQGVVKYPNVDPFAPNPARQISQLIKTGGIVLEQSEFPDDLDIDDEGDEAAPERKKGVVKIDDMDFGSDEDLNKMKQEVKDFFGEDVSFADDTEEDN